MPGKRSAGGTILRLADGTPASSVVRSRRRRIRVAFLNAQPTVRRRLEVSLSGKAGLLVVSIDSSLEDASLGTTASTPDVVIVDSLFSARAFRTVQQQFPLARTIVLSSADSEAEAREAVRGRFQGYLHESASVEEIVRAIETVHAGGLYFSARALRASLIARARKGEPLLTRREHEVLTLLAAGSTSREIAKSLGVGIPTVETHRWNIARKLGIRTMSGLTRLALEIGLIEAV